MKRINPTYFFNKKGEFILMRMVNHLEANGIKFQFKPKRYREKAARFYKLVNGEYVLESKLPTEQRLIVIMQKLLGASHFKMGYYHSVKSWYKAHLN